MNKQFNENNNTFNDDDNIDYISMLTDTSFLDSKKCDICDDIDDDIYNMLIDTSFLDF